MSDNTRLIPLTQGKSAIVDEEDVEFLRTFSWHAHRQMRQRGELWYAMAFVRGSVPHRVTYMHREIGIRMGLYPARDFDHRDNNGLHNYRSNIREASESQNRQNQLKTSILCTSQYKGVHWHNNRRSSKWRVQIRVNGSKFEVGQFDDEIEAALAYDSAARIHFGQFARLNFPLAEEQCALRPSQ